MGGNGGTGGSDEEVIPTPTPVVCGPFDTNVQGNVSQSFHINHIGYETAAPKHAVIESNGSLSTYQVVRGSNEVATCGDLISTGSFNAWGGGPNFYVADFSHLDEPGSYRLYVNGAFSETFEVGNNLLLNRTGRAVLNYFNGSRADDSSVWNADQSVLFQGSSSQRADVRGGWYDASGDISKYLSHLNYGNFTGPQQIPLVAWALAYVRDEREAALSELNLVSGFEAEALWGADYLVRVLDPAGYFYINVFDVWTGELSNRRICAFEGSNGMRTTAWQAAFREGGGMSIAALARIARWGRAGSFSAAEYLSAAERAFAHLQTNSNNYADDGMNNVIDDFTALLAASELYSATSNMTYLTAARARAAALRGRLHATGYFIANNGSRPFWHASDAGLPVVALARYIEVETDAAQIAAATETIETHLEYLVTVTNEVTNPFGYARQHFNSGGSLRSGFFIPHDNETGYWWQGESARLGSLAAAALIGGRKVYPSTSGLLGVPHDLAAYAARQLDWILGENPYDISFLSGFGRNNPPHYCAEKQPIHGHLDGGISNGITGREDDGSGIQWRSGASGAECWQDWRWVEQWLPHSSWFLVAIGAMAR